MEGRFLGPEAVKQTQRKWKGGREAGCGGARRGRAGYGNGTAPAQRRGGGGGATHPYRI